MRDYKVSEPVFRPGKTEKILGAMLFIPLVIFPLAILLFFYAYLPHHIREIDRRAEPSNQGLIWLQNGITSISPDLQR